MTARRSWCVVACVVVCLVVAVAIALLASRGDGDQAPGRSDSTAVASLGHALAVDADPLVVTQVRVAEAATDDEARDKCTNFTSADSVRGEWIIAGKNLNTTTTASASTPSGNTSFTYLCMHQARVRDVETNGTTVVQSVRVLASADCPSPLTTLLRPRQEVAVCVHTINASVGIATGMYVSDLVVTTVLELDSTVPGWTTEDTSIATTSLSDNTTTPVYVSYKRPMRPIVSTKVLTNVAPTDTPTACSQQLGDTWEQGGDGAISSDTQPVGETILCIERARLNATQLTDPVYSLPIMVVDVVLVPTSTNCSEGFTDRQLLTPRWALCFQYASSETTVRYISDLRLQRLNPNATLPSSPSSNALQELTTGDPDAPYSILYRHHSAITIGDADAADQTPANVGSRAAQTAIALDSASPLVARVSSNASEALTFKILQLADLHMTGDASHECRNPPKEMIDTGKICTEADTTAFVEKVLDAEHPDFVVFSGDNVEVPKDKSLMDALTAALGPVEKRKIPYALVFGNHDDENGQSRADMAERIIGREFSRMQWGPKSVSGVGNYELSVAAPSAGAWGPAGTRVFHMYFLDSHGYPNATLYPGVKSTYDWIKPDQVAYYKELARANRKGSNSSSSGGDGDKTTTSTADVVVPAVMFFHIPIPEYASAGTAPLYRSGEKNEHVASSEVQSNLLSALVEMGDVKATFVGHDHVNEYCFVRQGVQLCYGGGAGFAQAYGSAQFARRTRVVEWSVDAQNRRRIRSWKRHYGSGFDTRQHEEMLFEER